MKILFLSEAVSLAHVGRPLVLAKWAKENGVEVHFAASEKGLQKTQAHSFGFATHPIHTIDENLFYDRVNHAKFFYQADDLIKYVAEEQSLIIRLKPDLIVSDFRLSASISAELMGKPLLNLSNAYWSPNHPCPFPAPEAGIFKFLPQITTDFIFNLLRPLVFKSFGKELNEVRRHFGLNKINDFRKMYTDGTFTGYMDLPNFIKLEKLPEKHFFLGPVIWCPEIKCNHKTLDNKNNVYISMGSTGDNTLLPQVIHAILKNNLNIILSGINASEKKLLLKKNPALEGKSIIEPLLQADEILPFCKLTICHGGSGTVYQSIAKGVPVLCFPKNPDQGLVSISVTQNNIGRYLTSKNSNPAAIEKMISECITNEIILQNTKTMRENLHQWDTKKHWVLFLNKFKTIRKTNKIIA